MVSVKDQISGLGTKDGSQADSAQQTPPEGTAAPQASNDTGGDSAPDSPETQAADLQAQLERTKRQLKEEKNRNKRLRGEQEELRTLVVTQDQKIDALADFQAGILDEAGLKQRVAGVHATRYQSALAKRIHDREEAIIEDLQEFGLDITDPTSIPDELRPHVNRAVQAIQAKGERDLADAQLDIARMLQRLGRVSTNGGATAGAPIDPGDGPSKPDLPPVDNGRGATGAGVNVEQARREYIAGNMTRERYEKIMQEAKGFTYR